LGLDSCNMISKKLISTAVFVLFSNFSLAADVTPAPAPVGSPESSPSSVSSMANFQSSFQAGVKNYQEKKFDQAQVDFQQALEADPQNISALTNLALAQFQKGQKALAIALLRKATNLDPEFSTARVALNFILPQLEVKEIPHEILLSETLHRSLFSQFSIFAFSVVAALFVFAALWSLLQYLGGRRRALQQDQPMPAFSVLTLLFLVGAVVTFVLLGLKIVDQRATRATVISEQKIDVLSLPDEKAPSLFELYPGLEVFVNQQQKDWSQVTYPGGPTGWIPAAALFTTTEK
jgi:tetratricopeptide (TPR) repeat protein